MFRTITANSLLTTRGRYLVVAQQSDDETPVRRLAVIDSDTLTPVFQVDGEGAKDKLAAELNKLQMQYNAEDPNSIEGMMKKAIEDAEAVA